MSFIGRGGRGLGLARQTFCEVGAGFISGQRPIINKIRRTPNGRVFAQRELHFDIRWISRAFVASPLLRFSYLILTQ
jgi:hypothetical protein